MEKITNLAIIVLSIIFVLQYMFTREVLFSLFVLIACLFILTLDLRKVVGESIEGNS